LKPMLITCPNCATSYEVEAAKLGAEGRSVRCARCRTHWFVGALASANSADLPNATYARPTAAASGPNWAPEASLDVEWSKAPNGEIPQAGAMPARPGNSTALVIADAPPLAPVIDGSSTSESRVEVEENAVHKDIETAARRSRVAREARARKSGWRPSLPIVILGLAAVLAALIGWRTDVVRFAPQTALLYDAVGLAVNLRGLIIDSVKLTGETHEGVPVMVVEGSIRNVANRSVEVPRMRFALRNPAGVEVYAWTALPTQPTLAVGEALPFRSRLASPPGDTHDVVVRFFHRRDLDSPR
jgi:predicted Zn finger-like uncharacterized protein